MISGTAEHSPSGPAGPGRFAQVASANRPARAPVSSDEFRCRPNFQISGKGIGDMRGYASSWMTTKGTAMRSLGSIRVFNNHAHGGPDAHWIGAAYRLAGHRRYRGWAARRLQTPR